MLMFDLITFFGSMKRKFGRHWRKMVHILKGHKFDRRHLNRFNSLNCVPDIEAVVKFNAKQICNVMAAWMMYRRVYGCNKETTGRTDFTVWAPNKRMRVFLQHLTKWKVLEERPSEKFFYFGVNPTKRELQEVSSASEPGNPQEVGVIGGIIVGSDPHFLDKIDPMLFGNYTIWDTCILGPQKFVTSF